MTTTDTTTGDPTMANRITKDMLRRALIRYCDAASLPCSYRLVRVDDRTDRVKCDDYTENIANRALYLDHAGVYGGWVVCQYVNDAGGVTHPYEFGGTRVAARPMYDVLESAARAIHGWKLRNDFDEIDVQCLAMGRALRKLYCDWVVDAEDDDSTELATGSAGDVASAVFGILNSNGLEVR